MNQFTEEQRRRALLAEQAWREMLQAISESLQSGGADVKRIWSEERSNSLGLNCKSWDALGLHHAVFYGRDKSRRWTVRLVPREVP